MSRFFDRVKELRMEKGLTQTRLAEIIGYGQQTISDWEKGIKEPTANAIITCAVFFDVSTDYLLGLEHEDGSKIRLTDCFNADGSLDCIPFCKKNP